MIRSFVIALGAFALAAVPATAAAPCKDAKGRFMKCAPPVAAKSARCKDAKGKFAKCDAPGAKPV